MTETTGRLDEASVQIARLAAEFAGAGELNRRVAEPVVDAIIEAGFVRHYVPRQWGGLAGSFAEATRAIAQIGQGDTSAAWIASVFANASRFGAFLSEDAQAELWAGGPDQVIAGALVCDGSAEQVAGGWRLTGDWRYISGADVSDWALVCAPTLVDGAPRPRIFVLPRPDYTVVDSWNSTAMRATMSNTVHVDGAFVPSHRSFARELMLSGSPDPSMPACHRAPMRVASGLAFAAPIIGSATGALAATARHNARRKGLPRPGGEPKVELALTYASGEIQAAQLLIAQVATACDQGSFDSTERALHVRDTAVAASLAGSAVNRLMPLCGTAGFDERGEMQRHWRDVNCAMSHPAVQLDLAAADCGPMLLRQAG